MNFFGVGPWELVLIAILALIFIGPEKLPEIMRQIGRTVGELRRMSSELTREFQEELAPLQELQSELTGAPKAEQKTTSKPQQPAATVKPMSSPTSIAPPEGLQPPSSPTTSQAAGESKSSSTPVAHPKKAHSSEEAAVLKSEMVTFVATEAVHGPEDREGTPILSETAVEIPEQLSSTAVSGSTLEAVSIHPSETTDVLASTEMAAPSDGVVPFAKTEEKLQDSPGASPTTPPSSSVE